MKFEVDVQKLLETGGYFGHKISRTNPKAISYTYKAQNGIYLIDLFKTKLCLETALNALYKAGQTGEDLLVVATKRLIKAYAKEIVQGDNLYYLTHKWVGGFLTNFDEIYKNIKETNRMQTERERGDWETMPKHESSKLDKKLNKFLKAYEGVLKMERLPKNILIIDIKKEKNALKESLTMNLNIFAIADTNADPTVVHYPVVVNDDSALTLEYVLKLMIDAFSSGQKQPAVKKESKKNGKPQKS